MGATVWQRDGQGGKTFSTGIQQNQQRPGKRKLVWKREDQQAQRPDVPAQSYTAPPAQPSRPAAPVNGYKRPRTGAIPSGQVPRPVQPRPGPASAASEDWDGEVVFDLPDTEQNVDAGVSDSSGLHGAGSPAQQQSNGLRGGHHGGTGSHRGGGSIGAGAMNGQALSREQLEREEAEWKVRAAQEELEALKRGIAEREQRLAREQKEAAAREASERWQRHDMARRKSRLEAGFAEAFKLAKETAAADIAKSSRATVSAADAAEVARVLAAREDYAVLCVQPGATSAAVRKRYREMAVSLHPDKCRVPQATDAFQRLVRAYQELVRRGA
ncbi:probable DnaJ homolog subfamily C member 27 at C-terminar half [Coccomyxa sp. Obi]|nr:probable DnaJ homolog subfamily C member 27 at C-terminar half [Coccomyxa sp. Obi]